MEVFARLILRDTVETINLLAGLVLDGRSALAAVMTVWTTHSEFLYGRTSIKIWCERRARAPVPVPDLTWRFVD